MVKKIISVVLVSVFLSLTLSGCADFVKSMFSYWEGMSKSEVRALIEGKLEEKYSEEFSVLNTYKKGGDGFTYLMADCSPKSSSDIVFEIEAFEVGGGYIIRDTYIPSIVRVEMLEIINSVISEYSDKYAADVNVEGLYDEYDSRIRIAENATIKNFSEALPDKNSTDIWIALNDKNNSVHNDIQNIVEKIVADFYYTNAIIHFYYAEDDIVQKCIDEIKNNQPTDHLVLYRILYKHYPCDAFNFKGKKGTLTQIDYADKF